MYVKPRLFISYRRSDSEDIVGRIYDALVNAFGKENVFKDVNSIKFENFRASIERNIINCDYILVIIGTSWADVTDNDGNKRLDNPEDFVRIEIEMGFRHQKTLVPILVNNANMPSAEVLPSSLSDLAFMNASKIRNDPDFKQDIACLITNLRNWQSDNWSINHFKLKYLVMIIVGIILAVMILILAISQIDNSTNRITSLLSYTATLTATTTITLTPTSILSLTDTPAPTFTPTPTIDSTSTAEAIKQQIEDLIQSEAIASVSQDMGLIHRIFADNSLIHDRTKGEFSDNPVKYYSTKFSTVMICEAEHYDIVITEFGLDHIKATSASRGTWGLKHNNNGCRDPFDNPDGSDQWEFQRNSKGEWQIVSFSFR